MQFGLHLTKIETEKDELQSELFEYKSNGSFSSEGKDRIDAVEKMLQEERERANLAERKLTELDAAWTKAKASEQNNTQSQSGSGPRLMGWIKTSTFLS